MRRSPLLAVAALHAAASLGTPVASSAPAITITSDPTNYWVPSPMRKYSGFAGVPRYNQRKARKLARTCGIHPANAKRR